MIVALVEGMRPKQWLKNVLVLAAPLASGAIFHLENLPLIALTFVAFCAASSAIYLFNDILDRDVDRAHSTKRNRPIASGRLPVPVAAAWSVLLAAAAILGPLAARAPELTIVIVIYLVIQIAYCLWLKNVVVLDLVVVSSGFLLRAIAGGVALSVPLSQWFLLVTAFGSLFMVAGKRYSEKVSEAGGQTARPVIALYTAGFLRSIWTIAAAVLFVGYSLWVFELSETERLPLATASIVPFAVAALRYAYDIDGGRAGSPEETVLRDRVLLALGLVWLVLFGASVVLR